MAVISTGLVPKAMMGATRPGPPQLPPGPPGAPGGVDPGTLQALAALARRGQPRRSMLGIAQHNDGGCAHHGGSAMAFPCGENAMRRGAARDPR